MKENNTKIIEFRHTTAIMNIPLHVEVVQKRQSRSSKDYIKGIVHSYLSNFACLTPGAIITANDLEENLELREHVQSITFCDMDHETEVQMINTELVYHVYKLDNFGAETDTMTDTASGDELAAADVWALPSEEFHGLWESLVYDSKLKEDTLRFAETAFEFSDRGVDSTVVGCNRVLLLHGPPGTGKTVTIVEAILQIVHKNSKNRVMVCTDSNMAADHVATVLIKYAHLFPPNLLLRASSKYRVWETLPQSLVKYSNGACYNSFEAVSIDEFISYRIVITTLSHAAKFVKQFGLRKQRPITHLFIDEAAQASEPATLIPLCGLLDTTGSLVLAGDPLQLGPVVISNNARLLGLGLSLMERLMQTCPLYSTGENDKLDPNYTVMLRNNFRSDADILHIPNQLFYKGQLRAHAAEDKLSNKDILGKKMESRAIVFHGVLSQEQKMGKSPSFFNNMELEIVQMYITLLMKNHGVLPEDIGVVTPYIRQVYKIKTWLATKNLKKLEVGTVEAFQGKEKRVILVSTVRASCGLLDHDAKFRLGFLVDDKRFNVALTRAKAKAIIIGNPLCLEKDVKWRTYIERCRELGTYVGFDSRAAPDAAAQKDVLQRITPMLNDLKLKGDV